ncbi:hypothetical protein [Avibacterium paragallinarum]|uniref:hypothetical protein n=1 Tax=Avibacterium paragallinarum TaxID=728 RepID=UPI0039791BDB
MEQSDQIQRNSKKLRKSNVHVKLTDEELNALDNEMARIGIDSRSAMGRLLIRKALGMNQ